MPDLTFAVQGVEAPPFTAAPLLYFKLCVTNTDPEETISAVMLRSQIRFEPARRAYSPAEKHRLLDLFGEPERWGQTLRSLLWSNCDVVLPPFRGHVLVDLAVPCTVDLTIASAKYFNGLEGGHAPLCLLFSGTVFYEGPGGALQAAQIPWSKETVFDLPLETWKEMIERHYPNTAWLCLRRDVFDRLHDYKVAHGIPTWDQTMERLLA